MSLIEQLRADPTKYNTDPAFKASIDKISNFDRSRGWADKNYNTYLAEAVKLGATPDDIMSEADFVSKSGGQGTEGYSAVATPELEKLKSKKKIDALKTEAKGIGEEYVGKFKDERKTRRSELAKLLGEQSETAFSTNQPGILEDLSARGLLHSSGTGDALAKERARLATLESQALRGQELSDLDTEQSLQQAIMDRTLGYGDANLERSFSLDDIRMANEQAVNAARIQSEAAKQASQNQLISDVVGLGANVATGGMYGLAKGAGDELTQALAKKKTTGASGVLVK
jgi:hypothetical protein